MARYAIALVLLCAGCVVPGPSSGPAPARFDSIVPGKTTANEVRAMLGAPTRQVPALAGQAWSYPYRDAYMDPKVFWVEISPDGIVRETSSVPDYDERPYRF